MSHLKAAIRSSVSPPQSEPLRSDQVPNSAGGYAWEVDKWSHLRRFLVLGSAGGTYYIGEKDLTKEGLDTVKACLAEDGTKIVATIASISEDGSAAKNDYAVFALACAVAFGDDATKRQALATLSTVCRIGTHLFQFVDFLDSFGCLTGRAKRRALARWYTDKPVDKLAVQLVKYRNRFDWTHRDVLRVAHPGSLEPVGDGHADLFAWLADKNDFETVLPEIVEGFRAIQSEAKTAADAAGFIRTYGLPREAVPTEFLKSVEVWQALLDAGMPMTAMIRNLGNMTKVGLLTSQSEATRVVCAKLLNADAIRRSRVHPMNVLFALKTYASGGGFRSRGQWTPVTQVVNALDSAFYSAFGNVEPTGKRRLLALDVSGSMGAPICDTNMSCSEGAAAMALITEATEPNVEIMGFNTRPVPLTISSRQRLEDATRAVRAGGGTDCAAPMRYALEKGLEFDSLEIYTDSETWYGRVHPAVALKDYRKATGIDARMVVVGMAGNRFTIGCPDDPGTLDVVGFDSGAPQVISDFVAGRI